MVSLLSTCTLLKCFLCLIWSKDKARYMSETQSRVEYMRNHTRGSFTYTFLLVQ